jgi:hypothetical protein
MLTDRDMMILKHVETFNFITINQTVDMFFNTKSGYDMARRRLNKLIQSNYLKATRNNDTNEKIYYIDNFKNVSLHRMLLMNYYSKLISFGVEMKTFEKEKEWNNGSIRSDGFCIFKYGGYTFYQFIEIIVSHNDSNLVKYDKLYKSKTVQKLYSLSDDIFPTLIAIDNATHKKPVELENTKVILLDFSLKSVAQVFI